MTMASRRARNSSVFRLMSTTSMVTPASLPRSVRSDHSVSTQASASPSATTQRLGSAPLLTARRARHKSTRLARAMHQGGRLLACGRMVQPTTRRWKSVSRASRGRCAIASDFMGLRASPQGQPL